MWTQLIATILAATLCVSFDRVAAYSILLGGLVCVVPGMFAAYRLSRQTANVSVAASDMVMAELGKFTLTFGLLVVIFTQVKPLDALFFFGSLVVAHVFYVVVPLMDRHKQKMLG